MSRREVRNARTKESKDGNRGNKKGEGYRRNLSAT